MGSRPLEPYGMVPTGHLLLAAIAGQPYGVPEFRLFSQFCRVAHLPGKPVVAAFPGSSPTRQACGGRFPGQLTYPASLWRPLSRAAHLPGKPVAAAFPGSSPTRQNRSVALATSLFTKRQPNGCNFEGTYTSERFLTSRSVRRGQWVYKRGVRAG
jgi:hypothetical protein